MIWAFIVLAVFVMPGENKKLNSLCDREIQEGLFDSRIECRKYYIR